MSALSDCALVLARFAPARITAVALALCSLDRGFCGVYIVMLTAGDVAACSRVWSCLALWEYRSQHVWCAEYIIGKIGTVPLIVLTSIHLSATGLLQLGRAWVAMW